MLNQNIKNKSSSFRLLFRVVFFSFIAIGSYVYISNSDFLTNFSSEQILEKVSNTQHAFDSHAKVSNDGSFFSLGEFDGTIGGFIKMTPAAIGTTFFRPFIWEAKNLPMAFSALEGIFILLFVLKSLMSPRKIYRLLKRTFSDNLIFYCFAFSILFAAFVGLSTQNFGSLVRYKIPSIPFFLNALVMATYSSPKKK